MTIDELFQQLEAEEQRRNAALANNVNRRRPDAAELLAHIEGSNRLAPSLRLVGELAVARGMSISQTAAVLEIKRTTVRSHLRRLRAIVRRNQAVRQRQLAEEEFFRRLRSASS